jgi:glycosyltransferase involved in cell wall biosynthesis
VTPRHLCILTTAHPTDDVRVNSRMARSFLDAGYRVSWIGPEHAYFSNDPRPEAGIDYHLFRANTTRLRRLRAGRAARQTARQVRDVDWWYSPDPDAAGIARQVARRQGGRVLFDIHEVFHAGLLDRWFPGRAPRWARDLVRRRIARTCRGVDLVTGVSEAVMRPYVGPETVLVVTRNCAPRFFVGRIPDRRVSSAGALKVMHGKAIADNGTMRVLEAIEHLGEDDAAGLRVHFTQVTVGRPFAEALDRTLAKMARRQAVVLEPGVPHEEMPALLVTQDVGMIAYQRDLGVDSLPNRLFEYMAAGLAILAPSYSAEIVSIIDEEGIGLAVDFEDAAEVAKALSWCIDNREDVAAMGARARTAFLARFNWDAEVSGLVSMMREMEDA